MGESDSLREFRCRYARDSGIKVDNIPVTECAISACVYKNYLGFGDARMSGPKGTFCLREGNLPHKLAGLERAAQGV